MSFTRADVLALVPAVLQLEMVITKGGGWTLGLKVTDAAGANVDLSGTTAKITFADGTSWTATTGTSIYQWDVPKATVDAITWKSSYPTVLTVSDGTHTTPWAQGEARIQ